MRAAAAARLSCHLLACIYTTTPCEARRSMATPKRFPTLVQLEQRGGSLFQVLGNITKQPYWFHSDYLKSPKAVHLEAWLVEAIFGEWPERGSQCGLLPQLLPSPLRRHTASQGKPLLWPWPQSSDPRRLPLVLPPFPLSLPSPPLSLLHRSWRRAHSARRVRVADPAAR